MIDLEDEVRRVLRDRADEAEPALPAMPADVARRVRRRQTATVALTGLAAALVALVGLLGVRLVGLPPIVQPATTPPTESPGPPSFPVEPSVDMEEVASGAYRGMTWTLTAGRSGEIRCFEVKTEIEGTGQSTGSCERDPLGQRDMLAGAHNHPDFPAVVANGLVSGKVARVLFDLDSGGRIEGTIYRIPDSMLPPLDVFIIVVPRPARGAVMALDADGNILAQHGVYQPLGPRGLEDVYGNVVGTIPALDPLWHEWARPGTTASLERIESIRQVARFPLRNVWPAVREWWRDRPDPDAPDGAFLDWWSSYPVEEHRG